MTRNHSLSLPAKLESIPAATGFVEELLSQAGCPVGVQARLCIAVDEIFSNIARYAYPQGEGSVCLQMQAEAGRACLTFTDSGEAFDPLARTAPDTSAPLADRPIGGLGILVVRKTMDSVDYRRVDGQNVLTVEKAW